MKMLQLLHNLYFLFQFAQCKYCPYSYQSQLEIQNIGDPQDINWISFDFTPKVSVIYWFKYQPLRTGERILSADVVNQMISYQIDLDATLSVVHYLQLDQQQKRIKSIFQIVNSPDGIISLEYKILTFEGRWVAYKIYYDTETPKITISTTVDQDNEFSEFTRENLRIWSQDYFLEFGYITNLIKYGNTFQQSVLTKFTGMLSYSIASENIPDILEFAAQCPFTEKCTEETISLIQEENKFQGLNYLSLQTGFIDRNNYMIYGWMKCAQFQQLSDRLAVALRMSFNTDYTDDSKIGDKVLYILYQQSLKSSSNRIIVSTYSYEFPVIHSYTPQEDDKILITFPNLQESILEWHQFQFFFSYESTEQPYISMYFPSMDNQPRKYNWPKQLNHLSGANFALSIGGDKFTSNNFIGSISNFKVQNCPPNPQLQIPNCHQSCNECFGPTNQNCLSCYAGRIFNLAQNTCLCPEGSFEPDCKYLSDIYSYMIEIEIEETNQLNSNYCNFGEFLYQNICIQCPQNMQSNIGIYCGDCLENPLTWQNSLMCTYDYRTYFDESLNVYQKINRSEIHYNLYQIDEDKIELCFGCAQDGKCLNGFYKELDKCLLCSDGCFKCSSYGICTQCISGYHITQKLSCEQCKSCQTCEIQQDVEICLSCPQQFALNNNQMCQPCGIQCGGCIQKNCQYCSDSNMFVNYDGQNCTTCPLKNCLYCYQFRSSNHKYNTFNKFYSFEYQVMRLYSYEIQQGCAVCEDGYYLDKKTLQCFINTQIDANCRQTILDEFGVKICLIGNMDAIQQQQCNILNCLECIKQYKDNSDYCMTCSQGYYASARTGKCEECPSKCQNCVQYNTGYNDPWIWDIRPFYEYMFDLYQQNKNFLQQATSPYDTGYSVLCQSCQAGYILYQNECLSNCESNCNKCEIINGMPTCIQCKGSLIGPLKSYLNNQCLTCPLYCEFCLPRKQVYNQFYESNNDPIYQCFESTKYIDSFGIVTNCKNMKKCEQQIKIKLNVYCDQQSYQNELLKYQDQILFKQQNILFEDLFQWTFKFESDHMYHLFNEQSIKRIGIQFNILPGLIQCQIPQQGVISSNLLSNVFSLTQLDITIQSENQCNFLISDSFSLQNFTGINIKNIQLTSQNQNGRFIVDNTFLLISIYFQNIRILQNENNQIQLILDNIKTITLDSIQILNYSMISINPIFKVNTKRLLPIILEINQFSIINSTFQDVQIFNFQEFQLSENNQFILVNISIFNSVFQNSVFFQSNGAQYRIGSLSMFEFQLENVTFRDSQLIYSNTLSSFNCVNFILQNSQILSNSTLFSINMFQIFNFKALNVVINFSLLLQNLHLLLEDQDLTFKLQNITFDQIRYIDNKNTCILKFQRFSLINLNVYIEELTMNDVAIGNINKGESINVDFISYQYALIQIESDQLSLKNTVIHRGHGYPEISILSQKQILIESMFVDLMEKYFCKTLHQSFACVKDQILLDQHYIMYIGEYQYVNINNLQIKNCITMNYPLLIFNSIDTNQLLHKEIIQISNSIFNKNTLLLTELNYQTTILYISSMQSLKLIFSNTTFSDNNLHQYQNDENLMSTATFLINTYLAEVNLDNTLISSNCVTNSTNSIFYIFSKTLNLISVNIVNNNILNLDNLKRNLNYQTQEEMDEKVLKSIFQINSKYGIANLKQYQLNIDKLYLFNSYGVEVGAFYIQMIKEGIISITNSLISSTESKLTQTNIIQAGFLFIDFSVSSLQLTISNISLEYIFSRTGGSIYIVPSKVSNQIKFSNIFVHDSYSFGCSLLNIQSSEIVTSMSSLEISNIQINNSIELGQINQLKWIYQRFQGYEYLKKYKDLQDYEIIKIRTDNPMIQSDYSDIQIRNCKINNAIFTYFLKAESIKTLLIENFKFQQNSLILSKIFRIQPNQLYQSSIKLSNIQLNSLNSIWIEPTIRSDCSGVSELQPSYTMSCGNIKFNQQINNINPSDSKQLECNLQSIFKKQESSNFGLIELIQIRNTSNVLIENLIVTNVNCTDCTYGILSIQNITSNYIHLNNIILNNNICGIIGCVNMLKSIQNPDQFKVNQSQTRTLSENIEKEILTIDFQIVIQQSIFVNNTSDFGGALFVERLNILIKECLFQWNIARSSGGSIYYISENSDLILYQTQIIENQAKLGASLYLNSYQLNPYSEMGVLIQNSQFDAEIAEIPSQLSISLISNKVWFKTEQIINNPGNVVYQINQIDENLIYFPSGQSIRLYEIFDIANQIYIPMNLSLRILALNQFNMPMVNLKDKSCFLTPKLYNNSDNTIIDINKTTAYLDLKTVSFNETSGDFNLDDLIINLNPYNPEELFLRMIVECDMIRQPIFSNTPPYKLISLIDHYELYFYLRTLKCQVGEYYNDKTQACKQCNIDENQYSIKPHIDKCSIKNDVTMMEILPAMIKLKKGYWRPEYSNDQIEYCFHLENNCQGGWNYGDSSCAQGHIGALCEQCDLYNIRGQGSYALSDQYSCGSCELISHNILQLVLVSVWTMISLYISVQSTNEAIDEQILKQFFRIQKGVPIYSSISSTAILIKIFTNYLQIISVISTFQLNIENSIFTIIVNMSNPIESMLYSQDCFLIEMTTLNILYFRAIWTIIITIIYLVVFVIFYLVMILLKYQRYKFSIIFTAAIYIYIYLQPNLIRTNIKILSYREISQIKWILGNVAMKYITNTHIIWISGFILPFIFIIGILLPTLIFFKLYNNKKALVKIQFRKQWGYLYNEYHKDAYYWELIKIIQKMLIIFFIIFYSDYIEVKASLGLLMIFIYAYISQQQKPYLAGALNKIDLQQTNICAVTYILALTIYSSEKYQLIGINYICYVVIGFVNLFFILFLIWKIIDTFLIMLHELVDRLKLVIIAKFPRLKKSPCLKKYLETSESRQMRIRKRFKMIKNYLFSQVLKKSIIHKITRDLQYSIQNMPNE